VFEESELNKYRHDVKLTEIETNKVFYDKLNYIYIEMPKFEKTEKELETHFDKWMFVLKNLPKLDRIPVELKEKIFLRLFEVAEIARLKPEEYKRYEESVNAYRDIFNIQNTAFEKGEIKGLKKGKIEIAKEMIKDKEPVDKIMKYTGLTENEINELKQ